MKSVGAWVKRHPIWSGLILLVVALIVYQTLKPKTYDYVYVSETVTRGEVIRKVTASGKLRALNTIKVGAEVSGQVSRVAVDFNSPVKAGQVLAEIDPTRLRARVEQARAGVSSAEASLATAYAAAGRRWNRHRHPAARIRSAAPAGGARLHLAGGAGRSAGRGRHRRGIAAQQRGTDRDGAGPDRASARRIVVRHARPVAHPDRRAHVGRDHQPAWSSPAPPSPPASRRRTCSRSPPTPAGCRSRPASTKPISAKSRRVRKSASPSTPIPATASRRWCGRSARRRSRPTMW